MNREERRAEQKLGKRRLKWLHSESKHDKNIQKIIAELEENFEESEIANAKVFLADCLTQSGPFAEANDNDPIEQTCRYYGLEVADGLFILDTVEQVLTDKQSPEQENPDNR